MSVLVTQLVLGVVLSAPTPAHAGTEAARTGDLASTYDQATCATILQGEAQTDGWDRAAIGEDAPAPLPDEVACPVARPVLTDCNDPQLSAWVGEMIGTCDMPHTSGPRPNSVHAARGHDRRAQRLLVELTSANDAGPLVPTTTSEKDAPPALLGVVPTLPLPPRSALLAVSAPTAPRSLAYEPAVPPPRA